MKHLFWSLFLLVVGVGNAQDFEVAPVIINFNANPGEIQQKKVTVRNHSNTKETYNFVLGDYDIDENGKKERVPAGKSNRSCSNWLAINPSFIELNPNESKEVNVIITVPSDGFATKWGIIYVQPVKEQVSDPVDKNSVSSLTVTPRIVILVNQSPKANNNYKANLSNLREVTEQGDSIRSFEVTVNNIGDKIIEARINLAVADLTTAKEKKFEGIMQRVYPGEKRKIVLTLPNNIGKGQHALAAILDYGHGTNLEGAQILIDL